jgi:hypothetical protein
MKEAIQVVGRDVFSKLLTNVLKQQRTTKPATGAPPGSAPSPAPAPGAGPSTVVKINQQQTTTPNQPTQKLNTSTTVLPSSNVSGVFS